MPAAERENWIARRAGELNLIAVLPQRHVAVPFDDRDPAQGCKLGPQQGRNRLEFEAKRGAAGGRHSGNRHWLGRLRVHSQERARSDVLRIFGDCGQQLRVLCEPAVFEKHVHRLAALRIVEGTGQQLPVEQAQERIGESAVELAIERRRLLQRLRRETQFAAMLRIWLFLHVPLCCALLAALCIHVVTVFLYW